jgi:hypothetical protein
VRRLRHHAGDAVRVGLRRSTGGVDPDPRSTASASDLEAQLAFALEVRDRLTRIADMVETIRGVRDQLKDRNTRLAAVPQAASLIELGDQLIARLDAIEEALHNPDAEVDYDILAGRDGGAKLYSRLSWLSMGADDHDGPPTQGMREVAAELAEELGTEAEKLDTLLRDDLARLNTLAAELGVGYVTAPQAHGG